MGKIKLFCFPYAGGSTQMYHNWAVGLNQQIDVRPVELAGRGQRFREPLYRNFDELVDDVFWRIHGDIHAGQYAFFGHSLGALIAFELVQKIMNQGLPYPYHVFYSGKSAPNTASRKTTMYHLLDQEQFKKKIISLGGTPAGIFEHAEFEDLFLPVLRNDFKMAETYTYKSGRKLYDGDITVLLGRDDELSAAQCHDWNMCTSGVCTIVYFNGGHFFINDEHGRIISIINKTLVRKQPVTGL